MSTTTSATPPGATGTGTYISGTAYTNTGNVKINDNTFATVTLPVATQSDYFECTNFGFSLPTQIVIKGIQFYIYIKSSVSYDNSVVGGILKAGSPTGEYKFQTSLLTTEQAFGLGGSSDLWDGTWTKSDIENSGFGIEISTSTNATSQTHSIDYVVCEVTYNVISHSSTSVTYTYGTRLNDVGYWQANFTVTDATNYQIRTATGGGGTLLFSGACTAGANSKSHTNWVGIAEGNNTVYLRTGDGTNWSDSTALTVKYDNSDPTVSVAPTTTPSTVTSSKQYTVTTTFSDTYSTDTDELRFTVFTGANRTGTTLLTGTMTSGVSKTTTTITDSALANGANTRYFVVDDGAANPKEQSFTVTADIVYTQSVTGSLTGFSGSISRHISKALSSSVGALTGAYQSGVVYTNSLSGAVGSMTSAISRLISTQKTGSFTSSGSVNKHTTKSSAGTMGSLSATMDTVKAFLTSLTGSVGSFSGTIASVQTRFGVSVAGAISTLSGTFGKTMFKSITGSLSNITGRVSILSDIRYAIMKAGRVVTTRIKGGSA